MTVFKKNGGSELDKYIIYSPSEDKLVTSKSILNRPSSFYLGDGMSISNGIQALQIDLPTGKEGLALVQAFDRDNGTTESSKDFIFEPKEIVDVYTSSANVLNSIPQFSLTSTKDAGYSGIYIIPASVGNLVVEGTLKADGSGEVLYGTYKITQQHVDNNTPLYLEFPNLLVTKANTSIHVTFSGVDLRGQSNNPYLQVVRLPYRRIAITDGYIFTDDNPNTLRVGTEYLVNTQNREITLTVPAEFEDSFTVVDFKGNFNANKCIVDFSASGQGTVELQAKGDSFKFYKIYNEWWYHNFNFNNNNIDVGGKV